MLSIALRPLIDESWKLGSICEFSGVSQRFVDDRSILDDFSWLQTCRASYDQLWLAVIKSICELLGCKSSENHRVDSSDSGTSEHGEASLGHHWHVDNYSVSLLDLEFGFQDGGQLGDIFMQLFIGESLLHTCVCAIIGQRILVTSSLFHMPVNCIVANVHFSIGVPSVKILITCIQNFCEFFGPN